MQEHGHTALLPPEGPSAGETPASARPRDMDPPSPPSRGEGGSDPPPTAALTARLFSQLSAKPRASSEIFAFQSRVSFQNITSPLN